MTAVNYLEAQQNFPALLSKAAEESVIIDGMNGLKFIIAIYKNETQAPQKLSEKLRGSISDERAEELKKELMQMREEWNRDIC